MTWRLPSPYALERAPDLAALAILRAAVQVAQVALLGAHDSLPIEVHDELPPASVSAPRSSDSSKPSKLLTRCSG